MPNHVHLILVPATPDALGAVMGEAHRRYAAFINARALERWRVLGLGDQGDEEAHGAPPSHRHG